MLTTSVVRITSLHKLIGFMHGCTTSWTSASSLFPVCHHWPNL